jgi:Druantia protein DruA/DDE_Tnp_1-associated
VLETGVRDVVVRTITAGEVGRFNGELEAHHWLGYRLTGQVMRYVATVGGAWVALVGFGSAVLSCAARDAWVGWDRTQQYARLRHIANNQRFCVLPAGRVPNLASAVLARTLRRLGEDYLAAYGHRVVAVETFTDPARHSGACYAASNFTPVGHTLGFSRSAGSYHHHGNPKRVWMRALRRGAAAMLAAPFDHPLLIRSDTGHVDVNGLVLAGSGGLLSTLEDLVDPRARRGVRHRVAPVLAMAVVAGLAGAQSFTALAREVAGLPQAALARLGARRNRSTGAYVAPSEATIRRTIQMVDTERADELVGTWLSEQVRHGRVSMGQLGARLRPAPGHTVLTGLARHPVAARTRLFSALVHAEGAAAEKDQLPVCADGGDADEASA